MRPLSHRRFLRSCACLSALCFTLGATAEAQHAAVTVQVDVTHRNAKKPPSTSNTQDNSNVAVWLTPLAGPGDSAASSEQAPPIRQPAQLIQRNKTFEPHILVIQLHSVVHFPNQDPFFHNVFSLFDGKRFDLGLYEGGSTNSARFDRPGASFLFCNIHPEMSAIILAVDTPYFAVSDRSGRVAIPGVPDGRYTLHVWYERSSPEDLKDLDRTVTISSSARSLDPIHLTDSGDFQLTHKNLYGQDYPPASAPAYTHP